jgi:NAD(P)-dependent dehydrogenase (short-subunit alcohol dehydrogenase family)
MFEPSSLPSLEGRVFIVTGGNTGVGYATCLALVTKGARVYMGARSPAKAEEAIATIKSLQPKADISPLIFDQTSLASVVAASSTFKSKEELLHGLILNAGIMNYDYELTKDGFDIQMQVNYLAHWVLTKHLLAVLLKTSLILGAGTARVVCVSSEGHIYNGVKEVLYEASDLEKIGPYQRYGQTKLANVLHAMNLNDEYGPDSDNAKEGKGQIWTASLHPGFLDTQMNRHNRDRASWLLSWLHRVLIVLGIIRPSEEGCISSVFTGASPDFTKEMSGKYFKHLAQVSEPNIVAKDVNVRLSLEKWTEQEMKAGGWA